MMNLFALSLVLTTLLTASVHSPNPLKNQDVIVKEGHRVVMVEYDEEGDGNTKVSISKHDHANGIVKSVTDKISGLSGVIGGSTSKENAELVKDVASKSKSMFWGAAESGKDSITKKAKQASDMAGGVKSSAKGAAEATKQGMKETGEMARRRGKAAVGDAIHASKSWKGYIVSKVPKNVHDVLEIFRHPVRGLGLWLWHALFGSVRLYIDVLELFGFAFAYGMGIWITFLSNYILARVLPRQQFAYVQSKIYPLYFKTMASSVGLVLLGHLLSLLSEGRIKKFATLGNFQGWNLLLSLGMILANWLYYEPQISKMMVEKLKFEKEEGIGVQDTPAAIGTTRSSRSTEVSDASPTSGTTKETVVTETTETSEASRLKIIELSVALNNLHSYSSYINVVTLMGLTLHLVHLGQRLGPTY